MDPISILFVGGVWVVGLTAGSIIDRKRKKKKQVALREKEHHAMMLENPNIRYLHPDTNGTIREKPDTSSRPIGVLKGSQGFIPIDGYIVGQLVYQSGVSSDIWFRYNGGYIWSGLTSSHSTYGLRDYGRGYSVDEGPKRRQIEPGEEPDIPRNIQSYASEIEKLITDTRHLTP